MLEQIEPRLLLSASVAESEPSRVRAQPRQIERGKNAIRRKDVMRILRQSVRQAQLEGVKATISVVDREGNLLGMVRMAGAKTTVNINGGGTGGLEDAVDGLVFTSVISATKAGTAAFLSTNGNAFTTRTAGQIIQTNFPPGVRFQDGGPLFGVQLSSLPTSDVNRLPLGMAADPGGVPLYRRGKLVGGIGVEVDGQYTIDTTGVGGRATIEERIALAGQFGFLPPQAIRADRVFVDGIRFDYANSKGLRISVNTFGRLPRLNALADTGRLSFLVQPVGSGASKFRRATLGGIRGEAPNNADADFVNNAGKLSFLAGDANDGQRLTAADVRKILVNAHQLNAKLRAQIRKDRPQQSQVTVAVVDLNGNLLGAFRTADAPVFGYDVAVQKARSSAFFSRTDASILLATLGGDFANHMIAAQDLGVNFDGSIAISARTIGAIARPNLPDGIPGNLRGPLSALPRDTFSVFNTGLQTALLLEKVGGFVGDFATEVANNGGGDAGEAAALAAFANGTIGGGAVSGTNTTPTGLPAQAFANGLQIFSGGVPLYKNGRLVGAIGVSGDGIEQDDFVAFAGAKGFQQFGANVRRADQVVLRTPAVGGKGIRLPYVKLPRTPFGGF
jgi:uncharacterized protein GlcG (DUF336 family)